MISVANLESFLAFLNQLTNKQNCAWFWKIAASTYLINNSKKYQLLSDFKQLLFEYFQG